MKENSNEQLLEEILVNQDTNSKDIQQTLEHLFVQNHDNNPEALLELQVIQNEVNTDKIIAAIKEIPATEFPEQKEFPEIKIPEFPKEIKVSNQINTKSLEDKISAVEKAIKEREDKEINLTPVVDLLREIRDREDSEIVTIDLTSKLDELIDLIKLGQANTISGKKETDYTEKFDTLIKEIKRVAKSEGGITSVVGGGSVEIKNRAQAQINPSTEEKQDTQILHITDQTATGTLAVLNDAVEMTLNAKANTVFQITYTSFTGKIMFEAQVDSVWSSIYGFLAGTGQSKTEYSNPASGAVFRCSSAGFRKIRVRLSQATSGSATIYAVATNVTSGVFINFPLPEGGNNIGIVGLVDENEVRTSPAKETGGNLAAIANGGTKYNLKYDEGATYTYIGEAVPGTATSSALWRIKRLTNADNTIVWADGNASFDNIWDNRAGLSYS